MFVRSAGLYHFCHHLYLTVSCSGAGNGLASCCLLARFPFFGFFVPVVGPYIRTCARMIDHVGVDIDTDGVKEISKADSIDGFADALVFECILCKEIDHGFGQLIKLLEILVGLKLHERDYDGAHLVTDLQ